MKVRITFVPHDEAADADDDTGLTEAAYLAVGAALVEYGDDIYIVREEEEG